MTEYVRHVMTQTLFERARALQASGLSAEALHATLVKEGYAAADVVVILGSLGAGPQPRPDPTADTAPLTVVSRIARSRVLVGLFFVTVATMCGGAAWVATTLMAAFQRSR